MIYLLAFSLLELIEQDDTTALKYILKWNLLNRSLKDTRKPLHWVCIYDSRKIASKLLSQRRIRFDVRDYRKNTPVHLCAWYGRESILHMLLESGADPNVQNAHGYTPLHFAVYSGNLKVVRMLLESGADPNAYSYWKIYPLHIACMKGYLEIAKELILYGANVNARDWAGQTPLRYAYVYGNSEIVQLLIENGADTTLLDALCRNYKGETFPSCKR